MSDGRQQTQTGGRNAVDGWIQGDVALAVGLPPSAPPPGFHWYRLGDLARLESGHTPSRKVAEYWADGDIPWITVKEAAAHHGETLFDTEEHITALGEQNSSARLLPANTVCLTRTGSLGFVVVTGRPMCTSQGLVNWVCGPELDHRYLKYILLGESGSFDRFAWGSAHQTIYFPEVKAFHVLVPSVTEQRSIAEVLGALDDKIESNRRRQGLLHELLQASFRAFCGGATEQRRLSDLADFTKGVSYRSADLQPSSTAMVTLKSFDRRGGYKADGLKSYVGSFKQGQVLKQGELAVAQTDLTQGAEVVGRTIRIPHIAAFDTLVASLDLMVVRPKVGVTPEFLYGLLSTPGFREYCRSRTSGTTVLHLASDALPSFMARMPSEDVQHVFADMTAPLLADLDRIGVESETLASLRDLLLPELLAGRLRVRDAEGLLEEAV